MMQNDDEWTTQEVSLDPPFNRYWGLVIVLLALLILGDSVLFPILAKLSE